MGWTQGSSGEVNLRVEYLQRDTCCTRNVMVLDQSYKLVDT